MLGIRGYLLRLVGCGFVAAMACALVIQPRLKRIVRLCAGCLLALVALQPLITLDLSALPEQMERQLEAVPDPAQTAKEKNAELLEEMIRAQTEQAIRNELDTLGMDAEFVLTLQYRQELGASVPWSVAVTSRAEPAQKAAFAAYLTDELGIPPERQEWRSP